jgi:hypothetical protein
VELISNVHFFPPNQPQLIDIKPAVAVDAELPPGYGSIESNAIEDFDMGVDLLNSGDTPDWEFRLVPEERPLIKAWLRAVSQIPDVSEAVLATDLAIPIIDRTHDKRYY